MSLITDVMARPLDSGYAAEAAARARAGRPPSSGTRTPLLVVAAVAIGFLLAVAALSLRVPTTAAAADRARLITEINSQQAAGDQRAATLVDLRAEIQSAQQATLKRANNTDLADRLSRTEQAVGAVALTGPGLSLTLDDAKPKDTSADGDANPRTGPATDAGRLTASDLRVIVNGLWGSGAEAISINGQRLTSLAAIRFAGEAILVDFRPLARPYVVTVIGDPDTIERTFKSSEGGSYLASLQQSFGIQAAISNEKSVEVPASSGLTLRAATPMPVQTSASKPTTKDMP